MRRGFLGASHSLPSGNFLQQSADPFPLGSTQLMADVMSKKRSGKPLKFGDFGCNTRFFSTLKTLGKIWM